MRRWWIVPVLVALLLATATPIATAQSFPFCPPGQVPVFVFGFKALSDALGETMGDPLECEHAEPGTGDAHQQTSKGLSFYRKSTNTPTFTNGWEHWALTAEGMVYWTGTSIDPPGVVVPRAAPLPTPVHTPRPAATPVPTPQPTPTQASRSVPSWVPAQYCDRVGSVEFDCGAVTFVPLGQTVRIAVQNIGCLYPAISVGCSTIPSDQFIEVTVLQVERNVRGEGDTDPREEAVLARVRVRYVDGPLGRTYDGLAIPDTLDGWRTTDGRKGRNNYGPRRRPGLSSLKYGETGEGWVGGFIPAGVEFVMVARSGEHDYVFFGMTGATATPAAAATSTGNIVQAGPAAPTATPRPAATATPVPRQGPVTVSGTSSKKTESFRLVGGDYKVRWSANPSGYSCYFGAELRSVDVLGVYELMVNEVLDGSKGTTRGDTTVHALEPGTYYVDVDTTGCTWSITLEKL
ncbi:MAG: hypothetical protein HY690_15345 [Chloroflexi bacterium]|nr:hypothetical protein [Chloroflexota bacterium]